MMKIIQPFSIARLPRIEFGCGAFAKLPKLISQYGKRVLLVTGGQSLQATDNWAWLHAELKEHEIEWRHCTVSSEPSPELIEMAVGQHASENIDVVVGIGGGIFLSPVLYLLGWGTAQQIAATASGFIFVNSLAGLSGQYFKITDTLGLNPVMEFWPAFLAVLIGGQIGSRLSSERLSAVIIQRITAALVLYVALRICWQLLKI